MDEDIKNEIEEFLKIPKKDAKAIEQRLKETITTQQKPEQDDEETQGVENTSVFEQQKFDFRDEQNFGQESIRRPSFFKKCVTSVKNLFQVPYRRIVFTLYRLRGIRIQFSWKVMILLAILFLISLYIGNQFLVPEKPPIILE